MSEVIRLLLSSGWTPGATGIWIAVLLMIGWMTREWRETRKLSTNDRQARREGYARQVEIMMNDNRRLSDALHELRQEYDEYRRICHEETDQLRAEIRRLEFQLAGQDRQIKALSTSLPRVIDDKIKHRTARNMDQVANGQS